MALGEFSASGVVVEIPRGPSLPGGGCAAILELDKERGIAGVSQAL
jgi:hypothetical protein